MSAEFVNLYIERLIREIMELTKSKLLLETQLLMSEKANQDLSAKVAELESALEKKPSTKVSKPT